MLQAFEQYLSCFSHPAWPCSSKPYTNTQEGLRRTWPRPKESDTKQAKSEIKKKESNTVFRAPCASIGIVYEIPIFLSYYILLLYILYRILRIHYIHT